MDSLHSCRVEQEDQEKWFLSSISGRYHFWMSKENDPNWKHHQMTIEYQKTWEVMNGLEEAFNNIATIEFLVKELNYAIQVDETTLIEGAIEH